MADSRLTMLDVAKANSADALVGLIEEVATVAPEFSFFPAKLIPGTSYKTLHRTGLPGTGFRQANNGFEATKSTYELRNINTFIFGGKIEVDVAVADADDDGFGAVMAREGSGVLESAFIEIGKQLYYGVAEDANGFPGLQSIVSSELTYDAGGTTADTGSSVYGVRIATEQDLRFVLGRNTAFSLSPIRTESVSASTGTFDAYVSTMNSWIGLQATNKYAVGRIRDITEAEAAAKLDDTHIAKFIEKWPANRGPQYLLMNRRSLRQLQESRTATNATGAPAPFPTEAYGIPIVVTDSITSTEALS